MMEINQYVSVPEAARELEVSATHVRTLCQQGRIVGAHKVGKVWVMPSPVQVLSVVEKAGGAQGDLNASQAAAELGVSRMRMVQLCRLGRIAGARKVGKVWVIPTPVTRIPGRPGRPPAGDRQGE